MRSDPKWRLRSRCRNLSPEEADKLFFVGKGGKSNKAVEFCKQCPVRLLCLQWASHHKMEGFWGGLTDDERKTYAQSVDPNNTKILGTPDFDIDNYIIKPQTEAPQPIG